MTIKRHLFALAAFVAAALPAAVHAEPGNSAAIPGRAQAELVVVGRVQKIEDLRFGAFIQPSTAERVTIGTNGSATGTGDMVANMSIPQPSEGRGPAHLHLDGTDNRVFIAHIPNRINITNGTSTMQVRDITDNLTLGTNLFDLDGDFDLYIGGTLRVNANQEPGHYSGDFEVTVLFL